MSARPKWLVIAILSILIILGVVIGFKNGAVFHRRAGIMVAVVSELRVYAHDHGGWFPRGDKDSLEALRKLYPTYTSGPELAGLSGDIDAVVQCLKDGRPLTGKSSWVYVQGLNDTDDSRLALFWEIQPGLYGTGQNGQGPRLRGHLVSTIGGITGINGGDLVKNVVDAYWTNFLRQQEELRKAVLANRTAQGNAEVKQ
jgi:hypothetical protein